MRKRENETDRKRGMRRENKTGMERKMMREREQESGVGNRERKG
jgi:hypothetical protein